MNKIYLKSDIFKVDLKYHFRYHDYALDYTNGKLPLHCNVLIANACTFSQMGIYIYLFRVIRRKNNESLQSGVINNNTRQERRQKNLIHLSGQFTCFLVQFLGAMSIQVVSFLAPTMLSSYSALIWIICPKLVSVCLFMSSNELQQYVKCKLNV